ncbi:short chain dehydrogenase [Aliidiomarina minuta]|uniref:Short chain dehydrogenase n=1 Tax=Aliidiomarina minuta TaxID=880057 RepID=A0A432W7Q4_9GAMM|nr:SDR family oxidoreductase [Aliidiomarina minuta]RUO26031.1 short chain dehydrogenase [Aliidiomarina minuta]
MSTINGKTIWVTGASSGIGLALAEQLAAAGANLVLSARNQDKLKSLADRLPGTHIVFPLDLSRPEKAMAKADHFLEDIQVDILINNAGISQRSLALETDFEVYRDLMEVNYFSVVALSKMLAPHLIQQGGGHIVTVSSVAGKVGTKHRSGYSGAKFAVIGFMDCLRAELADKNVRCLTVCPGFVHTQIAHNALTGDGSQLGKADPDNAGGISAEECARQIIQAIQRNKDEIVVGKGLSKVAPMLQRFFPGLLRRLIARR